MTQRERGLLIAIIATIGLWGLWQGYTSYQAGYDDRVEQLSQLDDDLFDENLESMRAREALERLERFQEQSLPNDPEVARSVYSAWLVDTIQTAGLELDSVKFNSTRRQADAATALTFSVVAQGSPAGVVRLLDAYYRLDALHQITNLQLRAIAEENDSWSLSMTSVALVVDGATREAGLPESVESGEDDDALQRLRLATADEYVQSITSRNLFASYTPPAPPVEKPTVVSKPKEEKPKPPEFDDAKHAQLTGIVETGSGLEAWVFIRTSGKRLRLSAGDSLEVGQLKGRVQAVLPREIVVESEAGSTWRAQLGDKLFDAEAKKASKAT